jgi:threonylcarbamoyladenosine tRNA methylthiotransferase MtaB
VSGRVALTTLGCRLNQVDTQEIQAGLEARGFITVPLDGPADVVVVNTCTVTARAEFSDRQAIRRARRANPGARVVVTGCWAQTSPDDVARVGGVDLVVGNADKHRLPELVERLLAGAVAPPRISVTDLADARLSPLDLPVRGTGRARAFVKVQDGCQHRCAFCIVPFARGGSRSLAPSAVVAHVRRLVELGHPEVVLTGIDLGHYGADLTPRATLAGLVRALTALEGLRWLRLSSLLPAYFTDELVAALSSSSVVTPHFHVPLQSGSDRVLRAMRRPYTAARYRRIVERLSDLFPRLGLGADVLSGFPARRRMTSRPPCPSWRRCRSPISPSSRTPRATGRRRFRGPILSTQPRSDVALASCARSARRRPPHSAARSPVAWKRCSCSSGARATPVSWSG